MKISVVTISFNQAEFLERTILSVIGQKGVDFEYIIVDPGSHDASRNIIEKYRGVFSHVILEPDTGPGDGLNKGFARATGDILFYLNSDDTIEPGAFALAAHEFERAPLLDLICGHAWMIDAQDRPLRRLWSDPWHPVAQAYGAAIQIQPSTYMRARIFRKVGGFDPNDRATWDGELFDRVCLAGARMKVVNAFISNFRIYGTSISGGVLDPAKAERMTRARFRRILGRDMTRLDQYLMRFWWAYRQLRNPRACVERLLRGSLADQIAARAPVP